MSKFLWFVAGLLLGELGSGWAVHVIYLALIALIIWSGHGPVMCK